MEAGILVRLANCPFLAMLYGFKMGPPKVVQKHNSSANLIKGCRIIVSSGVYAGKHYVINIPGIHDQHYPTALCLDMGSIGVSKHSLKI